MILSRTYKRYLLLLALCAGPGLIRAQVNNLHTIQQYTSENKHCEISLKGQHYALNNQLEASSQVIQPLIESDCKENTSLKYNDYTFTLVGNSLVEPNHYFNWNNWNIIKTKGDGGVDVTGAPNNILVEGANSTLFNVTPGSLLRLSIAIPAEGFVTFDWSNIGGSNIFPQIHHNRKKLVSRNNSITSSLLLPGDTITISLHASSNDSNGAIKITNFEFFTNAISIINRHWVATDGNGHASDYSQLISVNQPSFSDLVLPKNADALVSHPSTTGYPVIDLDKDLSTLSDQYPLKDMPGYELIWNDEVTKSNDKTTIIRHWLIKDTQLGNTMEYSQTIKISNPSSFSNLEDLLDQSISTLMEEASLEDQNNYSTTTCMFMQVLNLYAEVL